MKEVFEDKNILITGGNGSIGKALTIKLLEFNPKSIRILDNRESEHFHMEEELREHTNLRFLLGDVRDQERMEMAAEDVDLIFHLAALKHVKSSEFNPFEAIKTNVNGTLNVINAALKNNVERVIYTSSDKAVNPNNTMGATKLLAERLVTAANYYKGKKRTIFSSVRFGNVLGTNGSVLHLWSSQIEKNVPITITNPEMTRFMISKEEAISLVLKCTKMSKGGEVFILKMPVIKIGDLVEVIIERAKKPVAKSIIGIKPGETLFESLMTDHEASRALETEELYIITSQFEEYLSTKAHTYENASKVKTQAYLSKDHEPISTEKINSMLDKIKI